MTAQKDKISILYVDQAIAFGGSLVVVGHIIDSLDKNKFRSVVFAELGRSVLKNHLKRDVPIYIEKRIYNYQAWMNTTSIIGKFPGKYLRKAIIYFLLAIRSIVNIPYVLALVRVILREDIDLIHVNNGMGNFTPIFISILLRRKFVVHVHGIETMGILGKLVVHKVPKFIAISNFIKQCMVANNFPEHRIVVIPNPTKSREVGSNEIDQLYKKYNILEDELIFGIVGRIVRWKGHVEFLNAVNLVLQALPEAKALIVGDVSDGDTDYAKSIMNTINKSCFKNRIIFTGYVPDVSAFYKIMNVCVHCSIEPEPFGLVLTEAMSYGVPVIASNLGAPKEIITDGKNGFIVKSESTEKMAELILKLLSDKDLRNRIGQSGKQHVESKYRLEEYGRAIEKAYLNVVREN